MATSVSRLEANTASRLTIDLAAIKDNYRRLADRSSTASCAAVVKSDAYGCGIAAVGPALFDAGARDFFVAQPSEGIELRAALRARSEDARIWILNGLMPGSARDYLAANLLPVLNSLGEIEEWRTQAAAEGRHLPAIVHIDTGMSRLGLEARDVMRLAEDPQQFSGLDVAYWMSHLVISEEPEHALNREQLSEFQGATARLPAAARTLANSSGIFLGPEYHFDLLRPGVALYGANPTPGNTNPMRQALRLQGKILQVRTIDAPRSVGYGATYRAAGPTRVATVAAGYADGYLRTLSNRGTAWIENTEVPVIGRVSMDMVTLDVTKVPEAALGRGAFVDLIDPRHDIDALAREAGSIAYELLVLLGQRYHRSYIGE